MKRRLDINGFALLMVLFLSVAPAVLASCGDDSSTGTCEEQWILAAGEESSSFQQPDAGLSAALDENDLQPDTIAFNFENESLSGKVERVITGNDSARIIMLNAKDTNNDLLNYEIVSPPGHGTIKGTAPNIVYLPEKGYSGNDSIVFSVNDGTGTERNITVAIDVVSLYHPPMVRIRSPQNGDIFTADPDPFDPVAIVPIHATSSGAGGEICLYDGLVEIPGSCENCPIGPDPLHPIVNCPITLLQPLEIGTHVLSAQATDTALKTCRSLPVVITVNPPEPIVNLVSPLAGEIFTAPAEITITADARDNVSPVLDVEFFANTQSIGKANESPYTITWHDVKPGVYNLRAKARDIYYSALSGSVLIIVVPVKPLSKANLAITKMCTPNPVPAGGRMNYLITVTNRGPSSASDVMVEDFLPPEMIPPIFAKASQGSYNPDTGMWSVGGLTKYRSAKLVLTVQVPLDAGPGQIANTAYVYGAEVDPDNSNNLATTYTRVRAASSSPELNASSGGLMPPDALLSIPI